MRLYRSNAHGWSGGGALLRPRRDPIGGWRFRWKQLRVLLLAAVLGAIAWPQILAADAPVAAEHAER